MQVIVFKKDQRRYAQNRRCFVGKTIRCSCGMRFKLQRQDNPLIEDDEFRDETTQTPLFRNHAIHCPKCGKGISFKCTRYYIGKNNC